MIVRRVERFPARVRRIEIEWEVGRTYIVRLPDGREADLTFDEMLATVVELCHPKLGKARYSFERPGASRFPQFDERRLLSAPDAPDAQCPID